MIARRATSRPARRRRRWMLLVVPAVLLGLVLTSYVRALTYPGSASLSARSVEWVREHGGAGVVDRVETWYYERQQPPATGIAIDPMAPADGTGPRPARSSRLVPPATAPVVSLIGTVRRMRGEGRWQPLDPRHALWGTWLRSDPRHLPVTASAVLVPRGRAALHLSGGTREPVVGALPLGSTHVPGSALPGLLATFNAGFKMQDSRGGWTDGGSVSVPLKAGRASLVIDRSGGWAVGSWGADVGPGPQVRAVRQNLDLVVVHRTPVNGLSRNADGRWGNAHQQFQYTWRSGVGVDAAGDLLYVAGRSMNLAMLAQAMARVGVVTGMQLDIHPGMVDFNINHAATGARPRMRHLMAAMGGTPWRYLTADQRDFFYLTVAGKP